MVTEHFLSKWWYAWICTLELIRILLPYLRASIISLEKRLFHENLPALSVLSQHSFIILYVFFEKSKRKVEHVSWLYDLNSLSDEVQLWHNLWKDKKINKEELRNLGLEEVVKEADHLFLPSYENCFLHFPGPTMKTNTIERSFSTLWKVKIWLLSTIN